MAIHCAEDSYIFLPVQIKIIQKNTLQLSKKMFYINANIFLFSGKISYTEVYKMLRDIDPPLGFGKKCPERMAYKKLIRMNMPMDAEGKVGRKNNKYSVQCGNQWMAKRSLL